MFGFTAVALGCALGSPIQVQETWGRAPLGRFQTSYVLGNLPPITIDTTFSGYGFAQRAAKRAGLQGRVLWVDGTANLDRLSSDASIQALVGRAAKAGFNTIVFDVKPISGQTLYPSKFAPKIEEWKGKKLPKEYDPLAAMCREAKANGLDLLVSLNAFSEGHNLFKAGPGYAKPLQQTVIYDAEPRVVVAPESMRQWRFVHRVGNQATPADVLAISLYTKPESLPKPAHNLFAVSVDANGRVVDGFDQAGENGVAPTIPRGGSVLVGRNDVAQWMRTWCVPGAKLEFKDYHHFQPIGLHPELQYPLMMNPHHPEVQAYAEAIVREILGVYDVKGVVYDDRLRYAGIYADFSPAARQDFQKWIGRELVWPDDVFRFTFTPTLQKGIRPGPYFDAWMAFRARTVQGFVERIRNVVKSERPGGYFGVYAGSWFGDYQQYGNNFAAPDFDAGFWFLSRDYRPTGFANKLDFLITGCYYPTPTIYEALQQGLAIGQSVESAGQLSNRVVRDSTWVYAGISLDQFKNDPARLGAALQSACASTQGVMVFDVSHGIDAMWPVFERAFAKPTKAPHTSKAVLERAQRDRRYFLAAGGKEPAVPIAAGSSGIGF